MSYEMNASEQIAAIEKGGAMGENSVQKKNEKPNNIPLVLPKKPQSSFFVFMIEYQARLKNEMADCPVPTRGKMSGEAWKLLSLEEKQTYVDKAELDKKRYQREMEEFRLKGYFVNKEGVKSTDIKPDLKLFSKDTVLPKPVCHPLVQFTKDPRREQRKAVL
jgi:hypothetical protein